MLLSKLRNLNLNSEEFSRSTFKYALGLASAKEFNDAAREAGVFDEEIKEFKKSNIQESEYTLSKLWKGAVFITERKSCKNCAFFNDCQKLDTLTSAKTCASYKFNYSKLYKKYGVDKEDALFIQNNLTNAEKKKLREKYAKRLKNEVKTLSIEDVYEDLKKWCYKFAFKKFRFIVKHYWDVELVDIVNEFMVEAQIRALECDTMTSEEHFLNTLKRRVKQRGNNILQKYTAGSRSRISQEDKSETYVNQIEFFAKRANLQHLTFEEKEKRFKNVVNPNHELMVLSLDFKQVDEDDDETGNLHDLVGRDQNYDQKREYAESLKKILCKVEDKKKRRAIKILVGQYDPEFDRHLQQFYNKKLEKNLPFKMKDDKYAKFVLDFLKIDESEFNDTVIKVLANEKIINRRNICKLAQLKPMNETLQILRL